MNIIIIFNIFYIYRSQYYYDKRYKRHYHSRPKSSSSLSFSEPKAKNKDTKDKKEQALDQTSKVSSAPKNNKPEDIKEPNDKAPEPQKTEELKSTKESS